MVSFSIRQFLVAALLGVQFAVVAAGLTDAENLSRQGDYARALTIYRDLLLDKEENARLLNSELAGAVYCLNRLNLISEFDQLLARTLEKRAGVAPLLQAAAREYMNVVHFGRRIDGQFERGYRAGNIGSSLVTFNRDRVMALRLYVAAMPLVERDYSSSDKAVFYWEFAQAVKQTDESSSEWKLAALTDLAVLLEPETGRFSYRERHPAPTKPDGMPIFYNLPASFEQAANDGERWRWLLNRAAVNGDEDRCQLAWADFLCGQFDAQTILSGMTGRKAAEVSAVQKELSALTDDETVAQVASGIRRFSLPAECNYLQIYRRLADKGNVGAARTLADVYLRRGQYDKAETVLRLCPSLQSNERLYQITSNLVEFEPVAMQSDVDKPQITFRYRNTRSVKFSAFRLKTDDLLKDVKHYLRSNPTMIDDERISISKIGYRLFSANNSRFLTEKIAEWSMALKPAVGHRDTFATTELPFHGSGSYLIRAELPGGYVCSTIAWLTSAVVVKKNLGTNAMFYVADAATGVPLPDVELNFFGYRQELLERPVRTANDKTRRFNVRTLDVTGMVDNNGIYYTNAARFPENYEWLMEAKQQGRTVALMGFSRFWTPVQEPDNKDGIKHFLVSDRPVYYPGDPIKFKIWSVKSGNPPLNGSNPLTGLNVSVVILDKAGKEKYRHDFVYDGWGALAGEYRLPADAKPGNYSVWIESTVAPRRQFCGNIQVNASALPTFVVRVLMPENGAILGQAFPITVKAEYVSGKPVKNVDVSYVLTRTVAPVRYFPSAPWDWLYGPGYWWRNSERKMSGASAWQATVPAVPEKVASGVGKLNSDGTFNLNIDTAEAERLLGHNDFIYQLEAKVTDAMRNTVCGIGQTAVLPLPFRVWCWTNRNYYQPGESVRINTAALNSDGIAVKVKGDVTIYAMGFTDNRVAETRVGVFAVETGDEEQSAVKFKADRPGRYHLVCRLADEAKNKVTVDYYFQVVANDIGKEAINFGGLEIIPDKREYRSDGDVVKLLLNSERPDTTVLLFTRQNSFPEIIKMNGRSMVKEIKVTAADVPNFFIQAISVAHGRVLADTVQIIVPPDKKVLNLSVTPASPRTAPGEVIKVKLKLTDMNSQPVIGTMAVAVYDKVLDSLCSKRREDIRHFFWSHIRYFLNSYETNLFTVNPILPPGQPAMLTLGFADQINAAGRKITNSLDENSLSLRDGTLMLDTAAGTTGEAAEMAIIPTGARPAPTAYWTANLRTDERGEAEFSLPAPTQLTTWKIKAWAMGEKNTVGEGEAEVLSTKDFMVRFAPPRFLVEGDKARITAFIHNYLFEPLAGTIELTASNSLQLQGASSRKFTVDPSGVAVVEWGTIAANPGNAQLVMKAAAEKYADGVIRDFPVILRGIERPMVINGVLIPGGESAELKFQPTKEARTARSSLTITCSPSLSSAVLGALPYLANSRKGCVEHELYRFLPMVMARKTLSAMGLNGQLSKLAADRDLIPLYSEHAADALINYNLTELAEEQHPDGGWGWYRKAGESSPHTTAVIVRGLLTAQKNGVYVNSDILRRGIEYLRKYQLRQLTVLQNELTSSKKNRFKAYADNLDALVFAVLCDAGVKTEAMKAFLCRDRNYLSVYGKVMLAYSLASIGASDEASKAARNVASYLQKDAENGTASLDCGDLTPWWLWYGSKVEANAAYLIFLARYGSDTEQATATMLARYLVNSRRWAVHWESPRDTALCLEALCEYLQRNRESDFNQNVKIVLNGNTVKEIKFTRDNFLTRDCSFMELGDKLPPGEQIIKIKRNDKGALYYTANLSRLEQDKIIPALGDELKITRTYYRLRTERNGDGENVERREKIDLDKTMVLCGEVVEVDLEISCASDYEYIMVEDFRPAGMELLPGDHGVSTSGKLSCHVESGKASLEFFCRELSPGRHHVSYRLRAENPGVFTALPARVSCIYAPQLCGSTNSDEVTIDINPKSSGNQ